MKSSAHFEVLTMSDIIEKNKLYDLLNIRCKKPDHSMLLCKFKWYDDLNIECNSEVVGDHSLNMKSKKRYRLQDRPDVMFNSVIAKNALNILIEEILLTRESQENLNILYHKLVNTVTEEMDREIPFILLKEASKHTKKKFKVSKPFWNNELTEMWKIMHENEKLFCKYKGKSRREKDKLFHTYKVSLKEFDKKLRFFERKYNEGLTQNIEEACLYDQKTFWQYVKKVGPGKNSKIPLEVLNEDGTVNNNVTDVLSKWSEDFSKLYNNVDHESNFDDKFYDECISQKEHIENNMKDPLYEQNKVLNAGISLEEVRKCVLKSRNKKATGIDEIPNEVLKHENVIVMLHQFLNLVFDCGLVPNLWKLAIINPIPKDKSRDKRIPLNYRGISLLCTMQKMYTSILNNRLLNFFETSGCLVEEQNGFRPNRSCLEHIFSLTSIIRNRQANGQDTFCAFIDFKKAFDVISRNMLLYKLLKCGVNGKMYNSIKSLYMDTEACVRLNSCFSPWFNTEDGVRQGDPLSPTLFALYINDLVTEIKNLNIGVKIDDMDVSALLYADDIVLCAESESDLCKMLDVVNTYCEKWRLNVNYEKSKTVHFRNKLKERSDEIIPLGKENLEWVPDYKYLGVVLNEFLTFDDNCMNLAKSAGRALGSVCNKFKSLKNMGFETFEKLFKACVLPVNEYGAGVWGYKSYSKCEQVMYKAARFYLGVHKFAPIYGLLGDVGWIPVMYRQWLSMLRLWNHLINLENHRLPKKFFEWDLKLSKKNWSSEIKLIFEKVNMSEYYENKMYCNLKQVNAGCEEIYVKEWTENTAKKPKLRTYVTFKEEFKTEPYVKMSLGRRNRSLMAQLRLGILPLRLESGRFVGEKVEERICGICEENQTEDECHFMLKCKTLNIVRSEYTVKFDQNVWEKLNDPEKLKYLMKEKPRETSKMLERMFSLRKHKLSLLCTTVK